MKIAFSTVVCPGWTLDQVIKAAVDMGYLGVEMRSFLESESPVLSDPMQMDPGEVQAKFAKAGVAAVSLATGVRLDKPIFPPVVGRMFVDEEEGVSETKEFVDFAARASVEYVRVYGLQVPTFEPRAWGDRRVGERLLLAAQTARNTRTRLLIENGGSYARASDLLDLINAFPNQWLGVSYNILAAYQAGECPIEGVRLLKDHLHMVKMIDVDAEYNPAILGDGIMPCRHMINELRAMDFDGWVVHEYPKLWVPEDGRNPSEVLRHASDTLYGWMQAEDSGCCVDSTCCCVGSV